MSMLLKIVLRVAEKRGAYPYLPTRKLRKNASVQAYPTVVRLRVS